MGSDSSEKMTYDYVFGKDLTEGGEIFAIDCEGIDGEGVEDLGDYGGGLGVCGAQVEGGEIREGDWSGERRRGERVECVGGVDCLGVYWGDQEGGEGNNKGNKPHFGKYIGIGVGGFRQAMV